MLTIISGTITAVFSNATLKNFQNYWLKPFTILFKHKTLQNSNLSYGMREWGGGGGGSGGVCYS